jgi:ring-1,2-phenylacetyl-CoA epoxidase subunit PaaE
MALFGLFSKKNKNEQGGKKGFHRISVSKVENLTADTVKVTLHIPEEWKTEFSFIPGQYLTLSVELNGVEERRSYSICSGPNEELAIAVKKVQNGKVSTWITTELAAEQELLVSKPQGNFNLKPTSKSVVAIAAGSGITPILSIAKSLENAGGSMQLFFGNRTENDIIFHQEIEALKQTKSTYYLSQENKSGYAAGRLDKENFVSEIKNNLDLLKADAFFICGPEKMIIDVSQALAFFGVAEEKIHFELFTTPVLLKQEEVTVSAAFEGNARVKAILDSEEVEFDLPVNGKSILDATEKAGLDAPFSCRGGVCCSCKAKVLEGSATMTMNYSLTESEVKEGYILTCQAHPASAELTVSFDV